MKPGRVLSGALVIHYISRNRYVIGIILFPVLIRQFRVDPVGGMGSVREEKGPASIIGIQKSPYPFCIPPVPFQQIRIICHKGIFH